jgi:hypothetical protein
MPKWVIQGFQAACVVVSGAAFCLLGVTAVFVATGFVNVTPDCVKGQLAHQNPLTIFGACVPPPGYGPWMVVFGVIGAALGLLLALGVIQLSGRIRSRRGRTTLAA